MNAIFLINMSENQPKDDDLNTSDVSLSSLSTDSDDSLNTTLCKNFTQFESKPTISEAFSLPDGDAPLLKLEECLGYDSRRRENLHLLDKNTLLFVAGSYVRLHKLTSKRNVYLRATGGGSVSCLAVHPNKEHFAWGETGKSPDINVLGYPSLRLSKVLRKGTVREYVCLRFDPYSGDLLASLGGDPDFSLTIWDWNKEAPLLRCKAFSQVCAS